jgi:hypothetical protein
MTDGNNPADGGTGTLGKPDNNHEPGEQSLTTQNVEDNLRTLLGGPPDGSADAGQEPPPDAATEQADDLSQQSGGDGEQAPAHEWPVSAKRRVDELTARNGNLKDKLAELEAQVAQLQKDGETRVTLPNDPLAFIGSKADLDKYSTSLKGHLRNIEDFLDEALPEDRRQEFNAWAKANGAYDEENQHYDLQRLKGLRRMAQDALQEYVPLKAQYFGAEAAESAKAEAAFPWLKQPESEEHKLYKQVLTAFPEIKRVPHWKGAACIFVRGLQVVTAEAKAKQGKPSKPAAPAARPAPRLPGASAAAPQRGGQPQGNVAGLRDKAFKSRNPQDFEALVRAQLEEAV